MQRKNFISMIFGIVGGILLALGIYMCIMFGSGAFMPGIIVAALGGDVIIMMMSVRRQTEENSVVSMNVRTAGTVLIGIAGALSLGTGMCMTMVWNMLIGIAVGIVGAFLLLCLVLIMRNC